MQNILLRAVSSHITGNKSRVKSFVAAILSIITGAGIHQKELALSLPGAAKDKSKTHRIYRLLKSFTIDFISIARLIIGLFGIESCVLAMDRTNWKLGKTDINILFLAVVINNISVPIMWEFLPHCGACSSELMREFLQKFLTYFSDIKIERLLADREFMNKDWLDFLKERKINFIIPLRSSMHLRLIQAGRTSLKKLSGAKAFTDLTPLGYEYSEGILWGCKVIIYASKNESGNLMILASSEELEQKAFEKYRHRWAIERLFKHLKSGGFDIEKSRIVCPKRYKKLIALAAVAAAIVIKQGLIEIGNQKVPMKKKGEVKVPLFSLFTLGFDRLKSCFRATVKCFIETLSRNLKPPDDLFLALLSSELKKM